MTERCPKCGVEQDPEHPICIHMSGRKGGRKMAERGSDYFRELGRRGGATTKSRIDAGELPPYTEIGKRGGVANKAKQRPSYFREIGTRGGAKMAALCAANRKA